MVSTSKIEIRTTSEQGAVSSNVSKELLAMATMVAPLDESKDERAAIDIVAVIDKSGSMQGENIKLVKDTLNFMLPQLRAADRLSIITYDDKVFTDLSLTNMDGPGKKRAEDVIKLIKADNSTNLSGGLFEGLNQLMKRQLSEQKSNNIASVLLFTDGQANVGLTAPKDFVSAIEGYKSKITGQFTIFTFGYGKGHNEELLRQIAECGKGIYYFIENPDQIPGSFADCIGGLLSVVAQNITMTIEGINGTILKEAITHYKTQKNGNKISVSFGDLYSEETRNIILKLEVPVLAADNLEYQALKVSVEYFDVLSTAPGSSSDSILTISRPNVAPENQEVPLILDMQKNRIETVSAIAKAQEIADRGDINAAKEHITQAISKMKVTASKNEGYTETLVEELESTKESLKSKEEYQNVGKKKMMWANQSHQQERSVGKGGYENKAKASMKQNFK